MDSAIEVIEAYLDAWNADDAAARARAVDTAWAPHGTFADPLARADGREQLLALIGETRARFPGAMFARTSGVDRHEGGVRFSWVMRGPEGNTIVEGLDVAELASDGRIRRLTGFFGDLPALEGAA